MLIGDFLVFVLNVLKLFINIEGEILFVSIFFRILVYGLKMIWVNWDKFVFYWVIFFERDNIEKVLIKC